MAQQIALLAIQLGIIIFAAKYMGILAAKCRIPAVMGELVAGILLGPFCLGGIGLPVHGLEQGLFPLSTAVMGVPVDGKLYAIASLGSIILLFLSGLETDVRTFFKYSVAGSLVGLGGIVFSFVCGAAVGVFALGWQFMDPRCLFLGILCTATSVGISARILSEKHAMDTPEGVTIMAAAVIDDVLGIVCLAIVIGIANVELTNGSMAWGSISWIAAKSFLIWLGVTALGLACARRLSCFVKWFKSSKVFAIMAFGLALILAGLFEMAGLAMIIGAFVMGLAFSKTDVAFKLRAALTPLYNFLVPVFFVVMGMLVDIRVLKDPNVLYIGLFFAFMAIVGKVVGCFVPAFLMNFNSVGALRIGVGMVPRCEVVLIIAGIAATTMMKNPALKDAAGATAAALPLEVPIFDSRLFGIAIIMPLVTALLAPPLLNMALTIKRRGIRKDVPDKDSLVTEFDFGNEMIASTILGEFIENMSRDGFLHSTFSRGIRIIQFRRDLTNINLELDGTTFKFFSTSAEVPLIKTAIYESIVDIHQTLSALKQLAQPEVMKSELKLESDAPQTVTHSDVLDLRKLISPECIIVGFKAKDKYDAIRQLLDVIASRAPELRKSQALDDVHQREKVVSTYLGDGIAMPHARTQGTGRFLTAIGIAADGIDYDGDGLHPVNLVILSLNPEDGTGPYLQYIARMAHILRIRDVHQALIQAKSAAEACEILHRG